MQLIDAESLPPALETWVSWHTAQSSPANDPDNHPPVPPGKPRPAPVKEPPDRPRPDPDPTPIDDPRPPKPRKLL